MAKLRKPRCLWPQVEGQWPPKALPSAEDRRGDAKRPPEIGLLAATVRKPEADALHSLGMTKGMPDQVGHDGEDFSTSFEMTEEGRFHGRGRGMTVQLPRALDWAVE